MEDEEQTDRGTGRQEGSKDTSPTIFIEVRSSSQSRLVLQSMLLNFCSQWWSILVWMLKNKTPPKFIFDTQCILYWEEYACSFVLCIERRERGLYCFSKSVFFRHKENESCLDDVFYCVLHREKRSWSLTVGGAGLSSSGASCVTLSSVEWTGPRVCCTCTS